MDNNQNSTMVQILKTARELLAKGWTCKAWARNKYEDSCPFDSKYAVSWCTEGALAAAQIIVDPDYRVYPDKDGMSSTQYFRKTLDIPCITSWNDNYKQTQRRVISTFDGLIKIALKDGDLK